MQVQNEHVTGESVGQALMARPYLSTSPLPPTRRAALWRLHPPPEARQERSTARAFLAIAPKSSAFMAPAGLQNAIRGKKKFPPTGFFSFRQTFNGLPRTPFPKPPSLLSLSLSPKMNFTPGLFPGPGAATMVRTT